MFAFYEIVRVVSPPKELSHLHGSSGAVLGRADDEIGSWSYGVHIYGHNEVFSLPHSALESTGKFADRSDFYPGDTIQVSSNGNLL